MFIRPYVKASAGRWLCRTLIGGLLVMFLAPSAGAALQASTSSPNEITLFWTAPGDDGDSGIAAVYDLRYSTSAITNGNWNSATQASGLPVPQQAGTAESFTVTGLNSSTTYYLAIKSADEIPNWSDLSNVVSSTTSAENIPPNAITTLTPILPTLTSITLSWISPGDDSTTGTAYQYDLRLSTSPITAANFDSATQVIGIGAPKPAGTPDSFTVSGLTEATTYYFAIKTADEVPNWSAISNIASLPTQSDQTPPAAINDLQVSTGSLHGQIWVSWTAPGDDSLSGAALAYEIRYDTLPISESNWTTATLIDDPPVPLQAGGSQSLAIDSLEPGIVYWVGIKAHDESANISALSNVDSAVSYFDLSLDIDDDQLAGLPDEFKLHQNYPNPFNPTTEISYSLPVSGHVNITVYNIRGQRTDVLVDQVMPAGNHTLQWAATDTHNQKVASGMYFYRLTTDSFSQSKKMILLK